MNNILQVAYSQDSVRTDDLMANPPVFHDTCGRDLPRRVQDNVHDLMVFDPIYWSFIDTVEFQRLREILQLGSSYYVYPGAVHTRFNHSLGVAHMAQNLMRQFRNDPRTPNLGITDRDERHVVLAGLLHDLGHGVYSHLFDKEVIPKLNVHGIQWSHEDASDMMAQYLVE